MPRRMYFHIKCDRCGTFQDASHNSGGVPEAPTGWCERNVIPPWAFGATPETVMLCRLCTSSVDAQMKRAWTDALKPDPQAAEDGDAR